MDGHGVRSCGRGPQHSQVPRSLQRRRLPSEVSGTQATGAIDRFFMLNRRMSRAVERRLPAAFTRHLLTVYKYDFAAAVNRRLGQTVLDIGGGRECPFLPDVRNPAAQVIIAVDRSDSELRFNRDLNTKIVADAAAPSFPFATAQSTWSSRDQSSSIFMTTVLSSPIARAYCGRAAR
jgi:hypothetical protein